MMSACCGGPDDAGRQGKGGRRRGGDTDRPPDLPLVYPISESISESMQLVAHPNNRMHHQQGTDKDNVTTFESIVERKRRPWP